MFVEKKSSTSERSPIRSSSRRCDWLNAAAATSTPALVMFTMHEPSLSRGARLDVAIGHRLSSTSRRLRAAAGVHPRYRGCARSHLPPLHWCTHASKSSGSSCGSLRHASGWHNTSWPSCFSIRDRAQSCALGRIVITKCVDAQSRDVNWPARLAYGTSDRLTASRESSDANALRLCVMRPAHNCASHSRHAGVVAPAPAEHSFTCARTRRGYANYMRGSVRMPWSAATMPMPAHPMCARSEWDDAQRMRLNDVQPCLRVQRLHLLVAADAVTCVTAELLGAVYVVVDGRHTEAAQTMIDRPRPRRACEEGAPARGVGPPRVPSTDATHGGGGVGGGHSRSRLRRSGGASWHTP